MECGEYGNFTLLNDNGEKVSSFWYNSHDLREVAPNVFSMFDNDFDNETNPTNDVSRMIEVTLNETNMTASISWSWIAPQEYYSPYWGSVERLPNCDRIGDFASVK